MAEDVRELGQQVCEKLGISEVGWCSGEYCWAVGGVEGRILEECKRLATTADAGDMRAMFPQVVTDPAAFDLVVEALGKRDTTMIIDLGTGLARIIADPAPSEWHEGATWREAVCRAVLEMED